MDLGLFKTNARHEALARRVLLEQPGVAAIEALEVERRRGRTRRVTASIRIQGEADAYDVCNDAAQALAERLGVVDTCLISAIAPGEPAA